MLILAVDTSGKNGSLALVRAEDFDLTSAKGRQMWGTQQNEPTSAKIPTQAKSGLEWGTQIEWGTRQFEVLELVPLAGRMYSAQIIPELQNALSRQNLKIADIDAYAVAAGPGSFTGLRVGLSTVKGLSEVLHKPIAAVSVLEAAARMAGHNRSVIVALDAGRKQVFVGNYRFGDDFAVEHAQESLVAYEDFFRSLYGTQAKVFSPDQAVRDAAINHSVAVTEIAALQADMFARIGYQKIIAGDTTPAEVLEANYIRASDAELFSLPKLMS
ncbi:MAG TPA: tRNA (adenosine(37)-N6)-threonylcarbamoyltransferase complex dimerization subunit type 1 TsaB [Terriglobales bacterium]|nr:tRNA (adenosine(37)-N6)-threonylcarbamoyltransferase complex dimerization subunit type 1 TsaB [Terriglobales bacterium]